MGKRREHTLEPKPSKSLDTLVKVIMQEGTVTSELKLLEHTQITRSVDKTNISGNVEKGTEN